jgi:hypothetical protein
MARADLIFIHCRQGIAPYRHYGIDMGDDTVVHLVSINANGQRLELKSMKVRRTTRDEFANGQTIRTSMVKNALSDDEVIRRAESQIGETAYDLAGWNCEHFARDCKVGIAVSQQVDAAEALGQAGLRSLAKVAVSFASKRAVGRAMLKTIPGGLLRVGRLTPAAFAADATECATHWVANRVGVEAELRDRYAKAVGCSTAAIVGFAQGGPVGSSAMVALHIASQRASDKALLAIRQCVGQRYSNADSSMDQPADTPSKD